MYKFESDDPVDYKYICIKKKCFSLNKITLAFPSILSIVSIISSVSFSSLSNLSSKVFWEIVNLLMTSALSLDTPSIEGVIKEFQPLQLGVCRSPDHA